jgi:phenylacetic acid degradation operon negative regulatory protein
MATPHGSALLQPDDGSVTPGSARSLLFTIFGELVWPTGKPVWTATLVQLLRGLGIEEQTARQAIARAASSDWITAARTGREVSWSLTSRLQRIFESGSVRVYSLSDSYSEWDGRWLVVLPTIPASHRSVRRPLYAGLTWAGLGNPAPGLWVTPHVERVTEIRELVDRLDLQRHTVSFAGTVEAIGLDQREIVDRGWDLASLREHYEQVEGVIGALAPRTPDEELFESIRLSNEYGVLPRTDPQLPEALLPDWIGRRVARRIDALLAQWKPAAHARFAEIDAANVSSRDPGPPGLPVPAR